MGVPRIRLSGSPAENGARSLQAAQKDVMNYFKCSALRAVLSVSSCLDMSNSKRTPFPSPSCIGCTREEATDMAKRVSMEEIVKVPVVIGKPRIKDDWTLNDTRPARRRR